LNWPEEWENEMLKKTADRGLFEFYRKNPDGADKLLFGRETYSDRRGFLKGAGLATMGAMVGTAIPFHRNIPANFIPIALAAQDTIEGKDGLTVFNDRPVNAETLPHFLDDAITPTKNHFIRNNGIAPDSFDAKGWKLTIDGLVDKSMTLTIDELKKKFEVVTAALQIECGGNGRGFFDPPAKGNQWTYGAVACSRWTGVRLGDVLKAAGVKKNAIYTAHVGADTHLSGKPGKLSLSRGLPISKAMQSQNLIAFAQNDAPIHPMNGAPLRLVVPGWPGSFSQKWLTRVWLRDVVHDGPKMTGAAYRLPPRPVAPGEKVDKKKMVFIESMIVKSLITNPPTGIKTSDKKIQVRGHAWAGDRTVKDVQISIDFGATWQKAALDAPVNPYAWQNWRTEVTFPQDGYYEIWAKATDSKGVSQPHAIAWNPKGYMNNTMHRVAVTVG
jgi:DMSO/TMAO reductase YedYZ molybdopterin-dependent catalytic subunit